MDWYVNHGRFHIEGLYANNVMVPRLCHEHHKGYLKSNW